MHESMHQATGRLLSERRERIEASGLLLHAIYLPVNYNFYQIVTGKRTSLGARLPQAGSASGSLQCVGS